jgi:endo-1,4-beta-D-glucanase Y
MCSPGTNVVINNKLYTPHCFNWKSKTYNGDVWVAAELEVNGSAAVKHYVEGKLVLEYEKPQLDPTDADGKKLIKDDELLLEEGYIALQAESHPTEFRKIEIKVLRK